MSTTMGHSSSPSGEPAPGGSERTFLGHPVGLFLLFLVEMWERFSYYGMRGLLVLYLTAAIAAHQLAQGTYENTLLIEEKPVAAAGATTNDPAASKVLRVPLMVSVGGARASAAPAVSGTPGELKFLKQKKTMDANGKATWTSTGEGLSAAAFAVEAGKASEGEEIRYRVSNTTDHPIKLEMKVERAYSAAEIAADAGKKDQINPKAKTYFKINDGTGIVSTTLPPDAQRDKDAEPFDLTIDLNRLDSGRSWIKALANTLYGWYTGMAYLLPIIGGIIADKLIGTHRSMIVGGLLIALGHIVLGLSGIGSLNLSDTGMTVFVFGLALITIGTGHFKPSVSVMVGQLYPRTDPRRESAFSIFYMGINLGAFTCNLACGTLAVVWGWHYGFAAAAIGMLLGLGIYLVGKPIFLKGIGETSSPHRGRAWMFLPVGVAIAAGVAYLAHLGILGRFDELVSNPIVYWVLVALAIGYAVWFIARQLPEDRGPVATIFIYMLFNAVFWLAFEQAGSSLNDFTEERTSRYLGSFLVPTAWFQSVNAGLIIVLAPIFGVFWAALLRRNKSIPQPAKIGLGLFFVGLGYVVMVLAAQKLNLGISKVSMVYICGLYFLHTVGEIILSPTGLSYVSKTAPKHAVSSLMGIWFISSFVAGLMAGKVGALVEPIIEGKKKLPWHLGGQADFFLLFVVTSAGAAVLIFVLTPFLIRLQRSRRD